MPVSVVADKDSFAGDGTANNRVTTALYYKSSELFVYELDSATPPVATLMVAGVDYTVVFPATLPGVATITPTAVIAIGDKWIAYRRVAATQQLAT